MAFQHYVVIAILMVAFLMMCTEARRRQSLDSLVHQSNEQEQKRSGKENLSLLLSSSSFLQKIQENYEKIADDDDATSFRRVPKMTLKLWKATLLSVVEEVCQDERVQQFFSLPKERSWSATELFLKKLCSSNKRTNDGIFDLLTKLSTHSEEKKGRNEKKEEEELSQMVQKLQTTIVELRKHIHTKVLHQEEMNKSSPPNPLPYWGFVPMVYGHAKISKNNVQFVTECGSNVSVQIVEYHEDSKFLPVNVFSQPSSLPPPYTDCTEHIYLTLGLQHENVDFKATTDTTHSPFNLTVLFNLSLVNSDKAWKWDLTSKGVRVYRFASDPLFRYLDMAETFLLFLPMVTNYLDPFSALTNANYFSTYSEIKPYTEPRTFPHIININTTFAAGEIRSGDLFAKMELDGLGPTEGIAQGTTSGHVAIALRDLQDPDKVFVCESIIPGISCTEWRNWTISLQKVGMNIVMVPLAEKFSQSFNLTKAWEYTNTILGNEYGYHNIFFSFIDTPNSNYPCFPPHFKRCLRYEHVELFMFAVDAMLPTLSKVFFGDAINHRSKTYGLPIYQAFYAAGTTLNMSSEFLMTVPEQDSWLYNITKRGQNGTFPGESMVCSTFACNVLRQTGVFQEINGDFECAETDTWDMFSLAIFDPKRMKSGRPKACRDADPLNPLCQILGPWTFYLNDHNIRSMWRQMDNNCSTQNPEYTHVGCFQP